jgi:cell division control protein 6
VAAVIEATRRSRGMPVGTGDAYKAFCDSTGLRSVTGRAFADLLAELDMYSLPRARVLSRGRYGRTREIMLEMSEELIQSMDTALRMNFRTG